MSEKETVTCQECGSLFVKARSKMEELCPECASILYGYENCKHIFENGKCIRCLWDGSRSAMTGSLSSILGNRSPSK
ncbi:MAG: hypothetical protein J5685_09105 [Clostridiales bacterium]|nr:hypothetical protein [Clostridiales bacterium]